MALRVMDAEPRRVRRSVLLQAAAWLPVVAGVSWACTAAVRGVQGLADTQVEQNTYAVILLLWAGFALAVSVLFPIVTLWPPRTWVSFSLLGSACVAGLVLVEEAGRSAPSNWDPRPSGPLGEVLGWMLWHTALGILFVVVLATVAVVVGYRDGAPLVGLAFGALTSGVITASLLISAPPLERLAGAAPQWIGLHYFGDVLRHWYPLQLAFLVATLVIAIVGLVKAARRHSLMVILFVALMMICLTVLALTGVVILGLYALDDF